APKSPYAGKSPFPPLNEEISITSRSQEYEHHVLHVRLVCVSVFQVRSLRLKQPHIFSRSSEYKRHSLLFRCARPVLAIHLNSLQPFSELNLLPTVLRPIVTTAHF